MNSPPLWSTESRRVVFGGRRQGVEARLARARTSMAAQQTAPAFQPLAATKHRSPIHIFRPPTHSLLPHHQSSRDTQSIKHICLISKSPLPPHNSDRRQRSRSRRRHETDTLARRVSFRPGGRLRRRACSPRESKKARGRARWDTTHPCRLEPPATSRSSSCGIGTTPRELA